MIQEDYFLINEIERIRTDNNRLWMDIVRVAIEADSIKAKKILWNITNNDQEISYLMEKLTKSKG